MCRTLAKYSYTHPKENSFGNSKEEYGSQKQNNYKKVKIQAGFSTGMGHRAVGGEYKMKTHGRYIDTFYDDTSTPIAIK